MDNLLDYLTAGHAKAGTWAALAGKLKVNPRTVTYWRQGKGWPEQRTMLRIAKYAKADEATALVMLQMWTNKGKVRATWQTILVTGGAG